MKKSIFPKSKLETSMNFVTVETRIIDCDFCGDETDDPFEVEGMLVCGHCILLVDLLEKFILFGGNEVFWFIRPKDGQVRMEL